MKTKIEGYITKAANGDEAKLKEYMESYDKCKDIRNAKFLLSRCKF